MDSLNFSKTDELESLDELIRFHLDILLSRLNRQHTVEDIQAEIVAINDLLQSYQLREELLEKLAEIGTPAGQRVKIEASLRRQKERLLEQAAGARSRSQQTHQQSQALRLKGKALMEKAMEAVKRAQRLIQ